jgi:regulator of cell morphogenesis and NO signaling
MHLLKEERVLFPLIKQLAEAQALFPIHCGSVNNPILVMEHEHEDAGSALERLRALTGNYQPPADGCPSYQALCEGLARLENDLHRHIHKENNILFPKAAALEAALRGTGG